MFFLIPIHLRQIPLESMLAMVPFTIEAVALLQFHTL